MSAHFRSDAAWAVRAMLAALGFFFVRARCAAADATEFPYPIRVELGSTEFAPGDRLVITTLRGDRPHLEIGGRYLLEGTYTLASAETAGLSWFITSRGPSRPVPIAASETTTVSKGSGRFRLVKTFLNDGWPHISFYVAGRAHGSVYFGETGVESTVLRDRPWSDFEGPPRSRIGPVSTTAPVPSSANAAIMAYLGDPVPLPPNLDSRYGPDAVAAAFGGASKTAGYQVKKIAVDRSEFPCLVYGLLAGKPDLRELQRALEATPGYAYSGSVSNRTAQGIFFALNLTPHDEIPSAQAAAVRRRLMIRLQVLAQKAEGE